MRRLRLWWRIALAVGALLICLPGHGLACALGHRSPWVRRFLGLAGRAFGLDARIAGVPLRRDVLFVANHISWLDIMALGGATGAAFVSRDDVARWPVVGWLARQGRTIFIDRASRGAVRGQADTLATALASGHPAALFPEGTTGDGRTLLPFRASLFAALEGAATGVRVQPVAIDYGGAEQEIAWIGNEGAGANAARVMARKGRLKATLRFLDPIDPAAQGNRKAIAAVAQGAITAALPQGQALDYRP